MSSPHLSLSFTHSTYRAYWIRNSTAVTAANTFHCKISDGIPFIRKPTSFTMVRGLNLSRGQIFCTCPDWPWSLPSLLYNGYWVSSPWIKWPGCGNDHPPPSRAKSSATLLLPVWAVTERSRENFTFYNQLQNLSWCNFPTSHFTSLESTWLTFASKHAVFLD